ALLLRTPIARATKDLDLHLFGAPDEVLKRLQGAGQRELNDFMRFEVQRHKRPDIIAEALPYGGQRFRIECSLAGKQYSVFSVDLAFAEPLLDEPETITGADLWYDMGLETPQFRLYPLTTHVAEKLHAYTLPRDRASNTRIKDLPDMGIIASMGAVDGAQLLKVIQQRFLDRGTHALPNCLPQPDSSWEGPYAKIAQESQLRWETLDEIYKSVADFLDPVLAGQGGTWNPESWTWHHTPPT
ncbi:MAG: nucleotidyl transferase AbiEii/AbiGii toxin family protein, partial [Myxococcota bacterium]